MKSNIIKIALIALIIAIGFSVFAIPQNALFSSGEAATYAEMSNDGGGATSSVQDIVGDIISALKIASLGVAVVMLLVLAMKYMSAAPSEKADIKKHAVVYVVGAVVMFAAAGILHIIQQFATSISGTKSGT